MAFNSAHSKCHRGWTTNPLGGRETQGIIWECLATIGLCTIVTLHVDVPPKPLTWFRLALRKSLWVLVGLLLPEFLCMIAVKQRLDAIEMMIKCKRRGIRISLPQAFFINTGGLGIRNLHKIDRTGLGVWSESRYPDGTVWCLGNKDEDQFYVIDDSDILFCAINLPSTEEIADKSKADIVAKVIAMAQAAWMIAQIVSRPFLHYTTSVLEIATLAYITMAVVSYYAWWEKPYDTNTKTIIDADRAKVTDKAFIHFDRWSPTSEFSTISFRSLLTVEMPHGEDFETTTPSVWFLSLGLLFAVIHCLAWEYGFPSLIERILWHTSFGVIAVTPSMLWVLYFVARSKPSWSWRPVAPWAIACGTLYLVARLYMIVEYFISFRRAPCGVYKQVYWTSVIGHIGA